MPLNDPFLPLRNWRSTLFRGNKPVIDRFIQQLDARLPAGWSRDSDYERKRQRQTISGATCSTSPAMHRSGSGSSW